MLHPSNIPRARLCVKHGAEARKQSVERREPTNNQATILCDAHIRRIYNWQRKPNHMGRHGKARLPNNVWTVFKGKQCLNWNLLAGRLTSERGIPDRGNMGTQRYSPTWHAKKAEHSLVLTKWKMQGKWGSRSGQGSDHRRLCCTCGLYCTGNGNHWGVSSSIHRHKSENEM